MNADQLTYGIEIECYIPNTAVAAANLVVGGYHNGRQIPNMPTGWQAQSDSSLTYLSGYTAIEVVSPVLRGIDGLQQVEQVCATLRLMGAITKRSCGFHVHVGWTGDLQALQRLASLTANHEDALFAITGTRSRLDSRFCKPIKACNSMKNLGTANRPTRTILNGCCDRYQVLNLVNLIYNSRPTVEFRVFAGTVSAVKMIAYIQVCLGLVQKAQESTKRASWDGKPSDRAAMATAGEGERSLWRLFLNLAWAGRPKSAKKYGVLLPNSLDASRAELRRLARKFDQQASVVAVN